MVDARRTMGGHSLHIRDLGEALIPADAAFYEKTRAQLAEEMGPVSDKPMEML